MANFFSNLFFGAKSARRMTVDFGKGATGIQADATTVSLKNYIMSDPELASNIRRFIDNVMKEAPKIVAKEGKEVKVETLTNYNDQLDSVRFFKLMRMGVFHLIWNGNAFYEIKFGKNKLKEMYAIDPEYMTIIMNDDGTEVLQYKQKVNDAETITFDPEEIVHISIDHLDSGVRGNAFIKALKDTLTRKAVAESYLQWILQKDKLAPIINVKAEFTKEDTWEYIVSAMNAKNASPDLLLLINTLPEDDIEILRLFTTADFKIIMEYIDEQNKKIISMLQVPPIISGTVDNSNRSNSEIQARLVFYNTITAFQNTLADEINFEMIREKLDWKDVVLKFPSVDQRTDTETIKLAQVLRNDLHFTNEAIKEFLVMNGFKLPKTDNLFDESLAVVTSNNVLGEAPSRQPRDKGGIPQNEAQRIEDKQMGVKTQ